MSWKFDVDYNGTPLTMTYSGTLDDTAKNMTGKITVEPVGVEGEFTAKKDDAKSK